MNGVYTLTLDERAELDKLLAEYANADIALRHAQGRRHDANHAVAEFISKHAKAQYAKGIDDGVAGMEMAAPVVIQTHDERAIEVPTGTMTGTMSLPPWSTSNFPIPTTAQSLGAKHEKQLAPVPDCSCATCCEARALEGIGKAKLLPAALRDEELPYPHGRVDEIAFTPDPATSGGN